MRYSARPVECVYCIIPLLLGYVSVREAEKSANLVGVFGQQIVIEISRLVYTARCDINLRQIASGSSEVWVDR